MRLFHLISLRCVPEFSNIWQGTSEKIRKGVRFLFVNSAIPEHNRYGTHQIGVCQGFRSFHQQKGNRHLHLIMLNKRDRAITLILIRYKRCNYGGFQQDMDFSSIEVFRYFLTNMEDQPWKDVRSAITPTFTTGKIKRVR